MPVQRQYIFTITSLKTKRRVKHLADEHVPVAPNTHHPLTLEMQQCRSISGKTKDGLFVLTSSFSFISSREHHSKQNTRSTHDLLFLIANKHVCNIAFKYIYINRCILFICRYISGGISFDETGCPLHPFGIVIRCSSTQLASMLSLYAIVFWSIHA